MQELSPEQRDAIGEIVNLGVGLGASALSQMTDDEILLSVPQVDLVSRRDAAKAVIGDTQRRLTAVVEHFDGGFGGQALLLFPEEKSLQLARTLLGDAVQLDAMTELEENALLEVGNVILNACLGAFADSLDLEIQTQLPFMIQGTAEQLLGRRSPEDEDGVVACLCIDFSLRFQAIGGFVTFMLDLGSIRRLKECVDVYLAALATLDG